MSQWKVIVTDFDYHTFQPEKAVLGKLGIELTFAQCKTEEEVIEAARDADGILNQYAPISRRVIENLEKCKVISRYGIGFNTVDIEAATEKGIVVGNVTDYSLDEVSNHAFALLLDGARKITKRNNDTKNGSWDYKAAGPVFRMRGSVVGLVGFGNIPQLLAKKIQGFDVTILAADPFVPEEVARELNVELVELDELCARSDYVSIHAPLNAGTEGMIGEEQLAKMKKSAFIVNTARGPIIDEEALLKALQNGVIAGAGLDVLEQEPIPANHPFLQMDNVILSPHAAWYSEEAELELKQKAAGNVADVLSGYFPTYLVNKDVKNSLSLQEKVDG